MKMVKDLTDSEAKLVDILEEIRDIEPVNNEIQVNCVRKLV